MVDRRPVSMVAIIGNDAVLAAAPATPVQIAHACLRRGFAVAVPASWGDELVAAEAVRRLASRERGPAVMCVCPFVRSRLLAPGPDLAPFLVSLVSPPVATARYLRAAYGDHGVHITYIGGCPSAEDPSIDDRLTPDAFLADLAEQGIALSEQPLVFDSIVPPDRRRWCSLPGGAPTAEILWGDSDTRTLVEIDRDDVSTDLAQHIITHEHVLLDLAPGLGCACSGAIGSLPPRSARSAVTAMEPPRASKPVIDPAPMVSLDVPVAEQVTSAPVTVSPPTIPAADISTADISLEQQLDELLGTPTDRQWPESELEAETGIIGEAAVPAVDSSVGADDPEPAATVTAPDVLTDSAPRPEALAYDVGEHSIMEAAAPELQVAVAAAAAGSDSSDEPTAPATDAPSRVRRRTPVPMPARYPAGAIPRATASDGKALPRAYVAKRRTPAAGSPPVAEAPHVVDVEAPIHEGQNGNAPSEAPSSPAPVAGVDPVAEPPAGGEALPQTGSALQPTEPETTGMADTSAMSGPPTAAPGTPSSDSSGAAPAGDQASGPEPQPAGGAAPATDTSPTTTLVVLVVALVVLGVFVLRSLR